jgi:hypothetical protein
MEEAVETLRIDAAGDRGMHGGSYDRVGAPAAGQAAAGTTRRRL